ncbi:MAG TPA: putative glycoside hydrolase [Candidatus Bathyarchaeia archaeon]
MHPHQKALSFTCLIVLLSQICLSFSSYSLTKTFVVSGIITDTHHSARILKHIVAYAPLTDAAANFIANHFDMAIVDFVYTTNFAKIKTYNPSTLLIGYRDIIAMHTTYEDWGEANAHEDWFIHDAYGNRIRETGYGFYLMDVGSQGWRQHYAQYCLQKLAQHPTVDGIFADDCIEAGVLSRGSWSSSVPSSVRNTWNDRMNGMLSYVKGSLGGKLLIINSNEYNGQFLQNSDGQMWEGFIHAAWEGSGQFRDYAYSEWELSVIQTLSATGKYVLVQSGSASSSDFQRLGTYCLAAALIAGGTSFNYAYSYSDPASQYFSTLDYNFGSPTGNMVKLAPGVYSREFSQAKVYVNLSPNPYNLSPTQTVNAHDSLID